MAGLPWGFETALLWDSLKDIGPAREEDVRVRITPDDGFEAPGIPGTTDPFVIDNRFVTPGAPVFKYRGPDFIAVSLDHGGIYPPAFRRGSRINPPT